MIYFQLCHLAAAWPWVGQFLQLPNQHGAVWSWTTMASSVPWTCSLRLFFLLSMTLRKSFCVCFLETMHLPKALLYYIFFIIYASVRTFTISHLLHVERKLVLKVWPKFSQWFLLKNFSLEQDSLKAAFVVQSGYWTGYGIGHKQIKSDLCTSCVWRIRPESGKPQRPCPTGNGKHLVLNYFLRFFHEITHGDGGELAIYYVCIAVQSSVRIADTILYSGIAPITKAVTFCQAAGIIQ